MYVREEGERGGVGNAWSELLWFVSYRKVGHSTSYRFNGSGAKPYAIAGKDGIRMQAIERRLLATNVVSTTHRMYNNGQ